MIFEKIRTENGEKKRIKSKYFFISSLIFLPISFYLIFLEPSKEFVLQGITLIFTVVPSLLIYPFIRELFFGGKDSIGAAVWSYIVEEWIKQKIFSSSKNKKTKR